MDTYATRRAGVCTLVSLGLFVVALLAVGVGANLEGVAFEYLAPPLRAESLQAFQGLRNYYLIAIWILVVALLLLGITPVGLYYTLSRARPVALGPAP